MKRSKHTPLWPYLGVVWCLFVLSLAAPRSWRSIAVDPDATGRLNTVAQAGPRPSTIQVSHAVTEPAQGRPQVSARPQVSSKRDETVAAKPAAREQAVHRADVRADHDTLSRPSPVRVESSRDRLAMRPLGRNDRTTVFRLPDVEASAGRA